MKNIKNVVNINNSDNSIEPQNVINMENTNKNLPRPTAEVISEYERVENELRGLDPSWPEEELNAYLDKEYELETCYDWSNVEFTDPATGKKGLKSVKGELIVPALYDSFSSIGSFTDDFGLIVAELDGKYGILSGTGSAELLVPFEYDSIVAIDDWNEYVARKGDHKEIIHINNFYYRRIKDMETARKNLPRPTTEVIKEFDELRMKSFEFPPVLTNEEERSMYNMEVCYDWSNVEFADPVTGKKGLKDVKGSIVIQALYDGFPWPGLYTDSEESIIAQCGGKYGFMSHTDSGEIIFDFVYDSVDAALEGQWEAGHEFDDSYDDIDVDIEDPPLPGW